MSNPIDKAVEELAKKLPVERIYDDAASGAAKQVGGLATDLVKTIRLALAPFQFTAAYQDRLANFIDRAIRRVPEDRQIPPPPQILGPVLEGIRYEPEGTEIDTMFSELLSRSIDRDRVGEAHPSYPMIIRQLSSDEARILALLGQRKFDFVYTQDYDRVKNLFIGPQRVEVDSFPRGNLHFPDNLPFYCHHLHSLGLTIIRQDGNQEPLFEWPGGPQSGVRVRCKYELKEFGEHFVRACIK